MHRAQQQDQGGKNGNNQPQSLSSAPEHMVVGVFFLTQSQRHGHEENQWYDVICHFFQILPSIHAAATPKPADIRLVTHTAGRMSKGDRHPSAARTAATLEGIS